MAQGDTDTTFVCPECRSEVPVTPPMRTALLEEGCVICGASVADNDFDAAVPAPERMSEEKPSMRPE